MSKVQSNSAGRGAAVPAPGKPTVLVVDAAGGLAGGLQEALLEGGYPVVAACASAVELERRRRRWAGQGGIDFIAGSVGTDRDAAALAATLRQRSERPLVAIVNLDGCFERGRVLEQPPGLVEGKVAELLALHLNAARHLIPLLAECGRCARYLVVNGPYAETAWLGYGHQSVGAAAVQMLARALRRETRDTPVRVQQLLVGSPVRCEENLHCACPEWPDALAVGRRAVEAIRQPPLEFLVRHGPEPLQSRVDSGRPQSTTE